MKRLTEFGPLVFAAALALFGAQHFLRAAKGFGLGPPWTPSCSVWLLLMGLVMIAAAGAIFAQKLARTAAILLGLAFFLRFALVYFPGLLANPRDPGSWTSGFEILALCAAALVLAGNLPSQADDIGGGAALNRFLNGGRFLFAIALVVFGAQHFRYYLFIASLVPEWIPARLFWSLFIGVAFFAAAFAIAARVQARLAAFLLGTMFFLWVLVLHIPRVVAAAHNQNEWTSAVVALAMGGASWIIALFFDANAFTTKDTK